MSDIQSQIPQKKKLKVKSDGLWLMSFADLSFVLMCFFALLLSFSSMDKQRFENVRDGMLAKSPEEVKDKPVTKKKMNNLKTISKKLIEEIKAQKLQATVKYDVKGVSIEFDDRLFFRSGSARFDGRYKHMTDKLMKIIAGSPDRYKLVLEGHTDDQPLGARAKYRDNWALSSARAVTMLKELKRRGVEESRMSVNAFAHTQPKMPYQGKTGQELAKARQANRRVIIRIE